MTRPLTRTARAPITRPTRSVLHAELLDLRDVPSATPFTDATPGGYTNGPRLDAEPVADAVAGGYSGDLQPVRLLDSARPRLAVATGPGLVTLVNVFDGPAGGMLGTITPFGAGYTAGARVAAGDVTGDGVADIVVATAAGVHPQVKVFDGRTLTETKAFAPYEGTFTGGVFVAVGDVTGDGRADIVTTAGDGGGPLVKVFDAADTDAPVRAYFAYEPEFRGGATLAVGDVDGDGSADIVTGAGVGGGPRVVVTSGRTGERLQDFFAFEPGTRGGVSVGVGRVGGKMTIATAQLDGSGNQVRLFADGYQTAMHTPFDPKDGKPQARTPAAVALTDLDDDDLVELVVATPAGQDQRVAILDPLTGEVEKAMPAVTPGYVGGLFVG
jgi:hypothetical protein